MTAFADGLRDAVLRHARIRAASAASTIAGRLRNAAPPCREWIHDEPGRPFPPHLALDAYAFEEDSDPGLATTAGYSWVGPQFHVGDHLGCLCSEGTIPRTFSVALTQDGPTRIVYTASTELARTRMVSRPTPVAVLAGGGSVTLPPPALAADVDVDDPARRSTWFRDVVAQWPQFLAGGF